MSGEIGQDGKVKPIDYDKLVDQFGTKLIDDALLERFECVTGQKPHRFLRRQIVFSHRDLEIILDKYEKNEPFFIYTGRGPSSDTMHIGHMVPFMLTKWLSDVFQVPLIVMLTDSALFEQDFLLTDAEADVCAVEQTRSILSARWTAKSTSMSTFHARTPRISLRLASIQTGPFSFQTTRTWAATSTETSPE